jgi:hypothetical protein
MEKNPHAVALGKLGAAKGGRARAQALSAVARQRIARKAAAARWQRSAPATAAHAPAAVTRLLKSYDPRKLRWTDRSARWAVVGAVLTRGDKGAWSWVLSVMTREEVRELARWSRGAGYSEPDRVRLRKKLRLGFKDIPARPFLGFRFA